VGNAHPEFFEHAMDVVILFELWKLPGAVDVKRYLLFR